MSKARSARKAEAPEVAAMLRRLDEAMLGVAPISHFSGTAADRQPSTASYLPVGAELGRSSALRTSQRDTVSDVFRKFGTSGDPTQVDRVSMANSLRFAMDHDSIGAAVTTRVGGAGGILRVQLGQSTLPASTMAGGVALPADAEVAKLCSDMAATHSADAERFKSFADTSTLGQRKAPLRDTVAIILTAQGAGQVSSSVYSAEHKYTPEVHAVLRLSFVAGLVVAFSCK